MTAGETIVSTNPATGDVLGEVQTASREDVDRAVSSARRALAGDWAHLTPDDRGRLLYRLSELVEEDRTAVSELEFAEFLFIGAGEGAFFITEKLALNEVFGNRAAVHGHERPGSSR